MLVACLLNVEQSFDMQTYSRNLHHMCQFIVPSSKITDYICFRLLLFTEKCNSKFMLPLPTICYAEETLPTIIYNMYHCSIQLSIPVINIRAISTLGSVLCLYW
jgi:hypothetical protein